MKNDIEVLAQLLSSMSDAVDKLEQAKEQNKIEDFKKIKDFIFKIHEKINEALE